MYKHLIAREHVTIHNNEVKIFSLRKRVVKYFNGVYFLLEKYSRMSCYAAFAKTKSPRVEPDKSNIMTISLSKILTNNASKIS